MGEDGKGEGKNGGRGGVCGVSIYATGSAPDRTPLWELTTLPLTPTRMVRGHLSPRFLPLDAASRSQDIQNGEGGDIGPRDNVFPGPAVALDGPGTCVVYM